MKAAKMSNNIHLEEKLNKFIEYVSKSRYIFVELVKILKSVCEDK